MQLDQLEKVVGSNWRALKPRAATMTIQFVPLAASAVQAQQIGTNSEDTDFWITQLSGVVTDNATDATFYADAPIIVTMRWGTTGLLVTDVGTHWNNLFGNDGLPRELPAPICIPARQQFYIYADNKIATALNARVTFMGVRVSAQ